MANRAKHARDRLRERVLAGRTTKTDLTTGRFDYMQMRDSLSPEDQAIHFQRLRLNTQRAADKERKRNQWRTAVRRKWTELPVSTFLSGARR